MKPVSKFAFIALVFLAAAALLRFWIAPLFELLPADYTNEALLVVEDRFRETPTGEWQASTLTARRVDRSISSTGETCLVEGALNVYFESGAVNFEYTSLYGVDRRSRANQPGYGTVERSGQYLFPAHVEQKTYPVWDPMFIGLRQATFDHIENIDGLPVYVFTFSGAGMDETAGYSFLPDVPERYRALTDGQGTLWIEPLSGMLVNYVDRGVSYFVDPASGARLPDGEFHLWRNAYTPETRAAQLALARAARLRILVLETWLPLALVGAGIILLMVSLRAHFAKQSPVRPEIASGGRTPPSQ
jgi:hypothetical protein